MIGEIEEELRAKGTEVETTDIGMAVLGRLRPLDQVAYLRFASVYRSFDTLDDFEAEIALLRAEGEPVGQEPVIPSTTSASATDADH